MVIRLILPVILVLVILTGGLWYWRVQTDKQTVSPKTEVTQAVTGAVEVPKALPGASLEDRVKSLEDLAAKLVAEVNKLKAGGTPQASAFPSTPQDLNTLQSAVTELKARVSALEKATPAPVSNSSQSTVYIPLGAGGGPWTDLDWNSLAEYEASLNPSNYPGYTGMSLEVNFRMNESAGTASVRLYNVTDNSATSSQLDTTSNTFSLKSSSSFKLPSGTKTYRLQVKTSQQTPVFIQSARIKVNF